MNYLLDTVTLLRAHDGTLPRKLERRLQRAETKLFVSIVSPWEIALKKSLQFQGYSNEVVGDLILELDAKILPITLDHTGIAGTLPQFQEHHDPFDRMIIAQALEKQCPVVTPDIRFPLYRHVGLEVLWD